MKCLEFFEIELNRIFNFRVNVKFVFFKGVGINVECILYLMKKLSYFGLKNVCL